MDEMRETCPVILSRELSIIGAAQITSKGPLGSNCTEKFATSQI